MALSDAMEKIGRSTVRGVEEFGFGASILVESLYWIVMGRRRSQPVRLGPISEEAVDIGIRALPILAVLSGAIGAMLAIQGMHTLKAFGAESQVVLGVAIGVTREFGPMITGILVAGRSGSALAARIGTMKTNEEIDALEVMGIKPARFLAVPALVAMLVMLPALTVFADFMGLLGAGLFISTELGMSLPNYFSQLFEIMEADDILHGLTKSFLFAVLITLVGVINGASVEGGAEGVGRATTRSVVHAIAAIVISDMLVVFILTR